MRAKYPKLAEMFSGREHLSDRIRSFWDDGGEEMCFTEMQILVHHAGATCETDPAAVWRAIEEAVATVPLTLDMPSEPLDELAIYVSRFRKLKESPELVREYLDLLKEVWTPVNDVWQQSLPVIEEAGRHVVAQYQNGQSLDLLVLPGCDILRDRAPRSRRTSKRGGPSSSSLACSSARACTSSSPIW